MMGEKIKPKEKKINFVEYDIQFAMPRAGLEPARGMTSEGF